MRGSSSRVSTNNQSPRFRRSIIDAAIYLSVFTIASNSRPFLPSAISFDRNSSTPALLMSESVSDRAANAQVLRFPLSTSSSILAFNASSVAPASWAYVNNAHDQEGIVYGDGYTWMSLNHKNGGRGDLVQ